MTPRSSGFFLVRIICQIMRQRLPINVYCSFIKRLKDGTFNSSNIGMAVQSKLGPRYFPSLPLTMNWRMKLDAVEDILGIHNALVLK